MRFFVPIRPLLGGWLLSFFGWGLVGLAMATHGVTTRGDAWSMHLEPGLRDWLPWAVWTPLLSRLVARLPLDRARWHLAVPVHLACCAFVIFTCHWWKGALDLGGGPGPRGRFAPGERGMEPPLAPRRHPPGNPEGPQPGFFEGDRPPPPRGEAFRGRPFPAGPERGRPPGWRPGQPFPRRGFDPLRFFSFHLPIYLMLLTGAHAALFFRREQARAASLARARLDALRMHLQPHFLFNTLNTIAGLIHEEPDKADAMLTSLSELLRMSLDTSKEHELPLEKELDFIERYLRLMHGRFEERLRFAIDAAPETRAALVPPMLLQPLVENAVEHGLLPKAEGGLVTVRATREGETLRLLVGDNGVGLSTEASLREGVGLGTTRARLRELYGGRATLTLHGGDGVTVEVRLPFRIIKPTDISA